MRNILVAAGCAFLLFACSCNTSSPPPVYRVPILETVVQPTSGATIVPELPDNSYMIFGPSLLHFRVLGDTNVKVVVDSIALPRQAQSTATSGWYEPAGSTVMASRSLFWDIAVQLPASALAVGKTNFPIEFIYDTVNNTQQPELRVILRLQGRDPTYSVTNPRPSDVFVDNSDNTKQDNRMENSIVAKGVTVAGWLIEGNPFRNDGVDLGTTETEDWHYAIYPDPDFIDRNYGTAYRVEPVQSAMIPGDVVPLSNGPATPIPLVPTGAKPSASTFLMAGSSVMDVELNAWHTVERGPKPSGWVNDPDMGNVHHSNNAWPYIPNKGSNDPNGPDLKSGDYVIVSGTLWEDTYHPGSADALHKCLEKQFKGHGGWLELHPVDAVRRVDPPPMRKHAVSLSTCGTSVPTFPTVLKHPAPPLDSSGQPDKNFSLTFVVQVDSRFTSSGATHSESVSTNCEPPVLAVNANAGGATGTYSATYILWWVPSSSPRTGTQTCTPPVNPILGTDP